MEMPRYVYDLILRYAKKFPIPQGEPGSEVEAACRLWSLHLAQTVAFYHGPLYGSKAAGPGRPLSKDTLAYNAPSGLVAWDLISGAGTGQGRLTSYPPHVYLIPDQQFVSHGSGVDWLVEDIEGDPPTPVPPDIKQRLEDIQTHLNVLDDKIEDIFTAVSVLRDVLQQERGIEISHRFIGKGTGKILAWGKE